MDENLIQRFAKLILTQIGLQTRRQDYPILSRKILTRVRELKYSDPQDYYKILTGEKAADQTEWLQLIPLITTPESYFFRDRRQFQLLKTVILPQLISRQQDSKQLQIWSAGCSTGEEPYSISLLLQELVPNYQDMNIRQVFNTFKNVEQVQLILVDIYEIENDVISAVQSFRGYLALRNPRFLREYDSYLEQFYSRADVVEQATIYQDQKERISRLRELVSEYDRVSRPALELAQQGEYDEAAALINSQNATQYVQQIDRVSQEITDREEEIWRQEVESTSQGLNWLTYALIMGTILVIILAIIIATLIATNINGIIQQATQIIASSSTDIAATLEQQERTANQQAAAVNETTTTMNELSISSKSTAEQAESAVTDAKQALSLTENGSEAVEKTLQKMSNLQEKVNAIAQQIIRLSEQTNQIGNISKLVSDLANQTNMLALNAAVEAVRAGEHGKRFAVVASEIRKLSDESQKSAQKINTLVSDIQNAINSTVTVTEEGTKTVISGVETAQMTASVLIGVSDSVNSAVLNNQQISLNTQQQAIAISQVLEAMNSINQGANETANGLNQTKTGLQKLNEVRLLWS